MVHVFGFKFFLPEHMQSVYVQSFCGATLKSDIKKSRKDSRLSINLAVWEL